MLKKVKDTLELVKELLQLLIELSATVKRHRGTVLMFASISLLMGATYWYSTHFPGFVLSTYLRAIGEQDCDTAWDALHEHHRAARWPSLKAFCDAYSTSGAHENVTVIPVSRSLNPFRAGAVSFEATYEVIDRFTQHTLSVPGQEVNKLWLELAHRNDYQRLIDGTLGTMAGANPSLSMRRRFKRRVTVRRSSRIGEWKISKFESLEDTLVHGD